MLSDLHAYRRSLEAKSRAKSCAEENKRRNHETPFLKPVKYARHGQKWTQYECSACGHDLHRTAKFCVECGAWFKKKKA